MHGEFRKFRKDNEVDDYIPPATAPGYFSNIPDVLVPHGYTDPGIYLIEKDVADLIRETKTPPPTPPELQPGRAGCAICQSDPHYVAPIYSDIEYQRRFSAKLLVGNSLSLMTTPLFMIIWMSDDLFDLFLLSNVWLFAGIFAVSVVLMVIFGYGVGLCRNPPWTYIALITRIIITTAVFNSGILLLHYLFLTHSTLDHSKTLHDDEGLVTDYNKKEEEGTDTAEDIDHPPPYMMTLIVMLLAIVRLVIGYLLVKRKFSVNDFRIPFVIYTVCFSTSALLVTVILNNGFKHVLLEYDLMQVILGCYLASVLLMRTPLFFKRLYGGKVCPLTEGEYIYALNHFGM